jgi:prepilin-type N-terminal cleavage/methylation domain-containing protein
MKNSINKNSQKGFTLVELAIVLVIIGLLIGGILVAQSMINTTKVQAFVRQIGQFDAGVANFKDKYQGLPGDSSTFNAGVGDSDGYINDDAAGILAEEHNNEIPDFWANLASTGLRNEQGVAYTGANDACTLNVTIPKAKLGTTTGIAAFGTDTASNVGNYYAGGKLGGTDATSVQLEPGITGNDQLAVDTKMDDGAGATGNVQGHTETGIVDLEAITTATADAITVGTTETVSLRIRMGSSTGDLY